MVQVNSIVRLNLDELPSADPDMLDDWGMTYDEYECFYKSAQRGDVCLVKSRACPGYFNILNMDTGAYYDAISAECLRVLYVG